VMNYALKLLKYTRKILIVLGKNLSRIPTIHPLPEEQETDTEVKHTGHNSQRPINIIQAN